MSFATPPAIVSAIRPAFEKGKASGDLLFFPSEVHTYKDLGIDVRKATILLLRLVLTTPSRLVRDKIVSGVIAKAPLADSALQLGYRRVRGEEAIGSVQIAVQPEPLCR